MLRAILYFAAVNGIVRNAELAYELGLSPELVEQILEQLTHYGYLKMIVPGCSIPCARCPMRKACLFGNQPKIWSLTPKGQIYVTRTLLIEGELQ